MQPVDPIDLVIPLRIAVHANTARELLVAPLWFLHADGAFWCASQARSLIVRALQREPSCAFDLSTNDMPYRGVRGRASVTLHPEEGERVLEALLNRYLGGTGSPLARRLLARASAEVALRLQPHWQSQWDYSKRMASVQRDGQG